MDVLMDLLSVAATHAVWASPLLLLVFRSVRHALARIASWCWAPVQRQLEARDVKLAALADSLDAMKLELLKAIAEISAELHHLKDQSSVLVASTRSRADTDDSIGYFECDSNGENVYVSATYAAWMGTTQKELLRWGFFTFTHPDDRERVEREWARAREQHREYREVVRMGPSGNYKPFTVVALPIPEAPPALAWVGTLRPWHDEARN